MPKLFYISIVRFPTEKAHGLQIAQNCEAFANAGYDVEFWVSNRRNISEMNAIEDPLQHYGVEAKFPIRRVPCIDLYPIAKSPFAERIAFYIQVLSFCISLFFILIFNRADIYYTRDEFALLAMSLFLPRKKLVFEAHQFRLSRQGTMLQSRIARYSQSIITITPKLRDDFITQYKINPEKILVAHDGIRLSRFKNLPAQDKARQAINWPENAFIVGFVGRLQMLNNLDKGVGTLVEALAQIDNVYLALVGGPEDGAEKLRQKWLDSSLPASHFLYAGQVAPDDVPTYLSAFDVCAMPHPHNTQFAYYTSPLKLFEYMASGRAIVASDLPSWTDVIQHEQNALLVPPGDLDALAQAIQRLKDNPTLREKLAQEARKNVLEHYTWTHRAQAIRNHIERDIIATKNE